MNSTAPLTPQSPQAGDGAPGPRLFLDSADRSEWAALLPSGLFYGVTTNPTILAAANLGCTLPTLAQLVRDALARGVTEIQVQSWGSSAARLTENGLALARLSPRLVVKVPITFDGIQAVASLHSAGVRTTLTAVYSAHQALTAAAAGAAYVAPYHGRIGDLGRDGLAEIGAMRRILANTASPTRLLVASIRSPADLAALAASGADTFTISPKVARALFDDPDTIAAASQFEATAAGATPAGGQA